MDLRERARFLQEFFGSMSVRSRVLLFVGIFCCFAPIGLLEHLTVLGRVSWMAVIVSGFYTGCLAMAYALVGLFMPAVWSRSWRIAIRALLAFITVAGVIWLRDAYPIPPPPTSLDADALIALRSRLDIARTASLAAAVLSYVAFIRLIQDEGQRYLRVRAEILLAREIHEALVVPLAGRNTIVEWRGASRASGDVGGDLVDCVPVDANETESNWFGCVADVTGHGVAAGVLMGMFKTAVRAGLPHASDLGDLLTHVNRTLVPLKQPNMFVTCACVRLSAPGRVEYVLAGHPPMLHVKPRSNRFEWIGNQQLAVGLIEVAQYESRFLDVESGDWLIIVTDGITEVFDRKDCEFGLDGVLRIAQQRLASPAVLEAAIFDACNRHGRQLDDQTVLIIRML
jgi:serine phosphatase RsbU (regulator of sigma subunit)